MNVKTLKLLIFLLMAGSMIPLSPLGAAHTEKAIQEGHSAKKERKEIKRVGWINQEDYRPGKKDMKMDGLSLGAYITTTTGLASLFLLPALGIVLLPVGCIMGLVAWRNKKRYEHRRGRGLALAAVAIGGGFTLAVAVTLIAFIVTFGIF